MSDLNTDTSAIIHEYVRESTPQSRQSIAEKLRALASLFQLYLATIANVRDATGNKLAVPDFALLWRWGWVILAPIHPPSHGGGPAIPSRAVA